MAHQNNSTPPRRRSAAHRFAALVMYDPPKAQRVAALIAQGHSMALALRAVRLSDQLGRVA